MINGGINVVIIEIMFFITLLMPIYTVDIICDRTKMWYKNGKYHRDGDLPAIEFNNGTKYWYKNDKYHRDGDLPAIEYANGYKLWYKNGIKYYPIIQLIVINIIKIKIIKIGNKWWYTV